MGQTLIWKRRRSGRKLMREFYEFLPKLVRTMALSGYCCRHFYFKCSVALFITLYNKCANGTIFENRITTNKIINSSIF